jgi:hypothetical protein
MHARRKFLRAIALGLPLSLLLAGCYHKWEVSSSRQQQSSDGGEGGGGGSGGGGGGGGGSGGY